MPNPNAPRAEVLRSRDFLGWLVSDTHGHKVGTVQDLLIDRTGVVRYLAVDPGFLKKAVLVPVELLTWGEDALVLEGWTAEQARALPPYDPAVPLTAAALDELRRAHPRWYARDELGEADAVRPESSIVPLKQAKDFKLSGGAPDLRGWNVFSADGERAGVVTEMLVDPAALKIRYLGVDLADDLFVLADDRHVVVPADNVDLRERGRDVWVHGLTAKQLAELPAYDGGPLDPLVQRRTDAAFAAAGSASAAPALSAGDATSLPAGDAHAALPPPQTDPAPAREPVIADRPAADDETRAPVGREGVAYEPPLPPDDAVRPPHLPGYATGDAPPPLPRDDAPPYGGHPRDDRPHAP